MSQKWINREYPIRIQAVGPDEDGSTDVVIRPGSRPFRVTSIVAVEDGFCLVQCVAGRRALIKKKDDIVFPVTGLCGEVAVGEVITVAVRNKTKDQRDFVGKILGEELLPR